jgi:hypothetical protein
MPDIEQRRFVGLDPAPIGPPVMISGWLDEEGALHIDARDRIDIQDARQAVRGRYAAMLTEDGAYSGLHKCEKPDCFRQVKTGVAHCCLPCSTAAAGRYEIHEHSDGCGQRHAERGPWLTSVQAMEKLLDEATAHPCEQPGAGREFGAIGDATIDGERLTYRG